MATYLDRAREGDCRARSYVRGLLLVLFFWQVLGALAAGALVLMLRPPDVSVRQAIRFLDDPFRYGAIRGGIVLLSMSVFGLTGLILAMRRTLRRPVLSLMSPDDGIDRRRLFHATGLWFGLLCLTSLGRFALAPSWYRVSLDPAAFLSFLPVALVFVSAQIAFEELLFRGYLIQWFSLASRKPWILVAASAVIFGLPHLSNPEASKSPSIALAYYAGIGAFLAAWSLRDGRLETALGVHLGNNLFGALVLSFKSSIFQTPTIFYCRGFEPRLDLLELILAGAVFTILTRRRRDRGSDGRSHG